MALQEACIFTQIVKALEATRVRNEVLKMLPSKYGLTSRTLYKSTANIVFRLESEMNLALLKPDVCKALVSCNENKIAEELTPDPDMSFVIKRDLSCADKHVTRNVLGKLSAAELQHLAMVLCIMRVIERAEIYQSAFEIVTTLVRRDRRAWLTHIYNALHASDLERTAEALCVRGGTTTCCDPFQLTASLIDLQRQRIKEVYFDTVSRLCEGCFAKVILYCWNMHGITDAQYRRIRSVDYPNDAFVDALVETTGEREFTLTTLTLKNCLVRAQKRDIAEKLQDSISNILFVD